MLILSMRKTFRYFERYVLLFFTKPKLIQSEFDHECKWICDVMRKFEAYYNRKFHYPKLALLIDEIISHYDLKKMRIHDRIWLTDEGYFENIVCQLLKAEGNIGIIIEFVFFCLRSTDIVYYYTSEVCPNLSECNCEKLDVTEKKYKYTIIILNRIVGQKHTNIVIVPLASGRSLECYHFNSQ